MLEIIAVQDSKNPDWVVAFTASYRDKDDVIHRGECIPFRKTEAEALDLKVGDKIANPEA